MTKVLWFSDFFLGILSLNLANLTVFVVILSLHHAILLSWNPHNSKFTSLSSNFSLGILSLHFTTDFFGMLNLHFAILTFFSGILSSRNSVFFVVVLSIHHRILYFFIRIVCLSISDRLLRLYHAIMILFSFRIAKKSRKCEVKIITIPLYLFIYVTCGQCCQLLSIVSS